MASVVDICNRALQKLGADAIVSLTQNTENARQCNLCYEILRDAELRSHPWNFSIKRAQLAADVKAPDFGYDLQYQLPNDFLRLLPAYHFDTNRGADYQIEGRYLLTNLGAPLQLRYVAKVTDPNQFDALFVELLATRIAMDLCERLTQSATKWQILQSEYTRIMRDAKRLNAFENVAIDPMTDSWITGRQ